MVYPMNREQKIEVNVKRALIPVLIVLTIASAVAMVFFQDKVGGMINSLQRANYYYVFLAFALYFTSAILWSKRWGIGISMLGKSTRLKYLFPIVWGSMFINNMTPLNRAGGDPVGRPYLLKKVSGIKFRNGFAAVVAEQILQIPVFLILLAIGLLMRLRMLPSGSPMTLALIAISTLLGITLIPFFITLFGRKDFSTKIAGFIEWILNLINREADKNDIIDTIEDFRTGSRRILGSKKSAFLMVGLTVIIWIMDLFRIMFILLALGIDINLPILILASTLPQVAGLVPLLPGGVGVVEATLVTVLMWFEIPAGLAMSATLIERSMSYLFSTLFGAGALSYIGLKVWKKD